VPDPDVDGQIEPPQPIKTKVVFHHIFPFLKADEAARLRKTQEDVEAGRIDVLELYRAASGIFKAEQDAADGRMLTRAERRDVGL
jgi:hypothetical protein